MPFDCLPRGGWARKLAHCMPDAVPTSESRSAKAVLPPLLAPGQVVAGYEVQELVGKGGMGEVYRARQLSMDREVALKILSPKLARKDPSFAKLFVDEARAAGKLNHPNIIHVHDVGTANLPDDRGEIHYFSMEFIEGESVQDILRREHRLQPAVIGQVMLGVAEALGFAAKVGIVHRDIKPDNIMVSKGGLVKVADLGLATASQTGDDHLPERDEKGRAKVMGTPLYLSPEQARALPVDFRSDQYSLGATLYHMLTGEPPYRGSDAKSIMRSHVVDPVPDPLDVNPQADRAWSELCSRLMQKLPEERFDSESLLIKAVEAATHGISLEQMRRKELGFQMPQWAWYVGGGFIMVIILWLLFAQGNGPAPLPVPEPVSVQPTPATQPKQTAPEPLKPPVATPVVAPLPAQAVIEQALNEQRLKDAFTLIATLPAADQVRPEIKALTERLGAARTATRAALTAKVTAANMTELDGVTKSAAVKPLPDEDQTWLQGQVAARRAALVPAKPADAERWRDLARELDKRRATLAYGEIRTLVDQAAVTFTDPLAKPWLKSLAELGPLAQNGEGALRAFIGAAQPHSAVVIGGKKIDVLLSRLSRTDVYYIVQGDGAPSTEQKIVRTQIGLPWAQLLDEALKDQGVEKAPQVKAACLWMWNLAEAKPAFVALGATNPLAIAVTELEQRRK